ncbi:hypothetical protein M9458_031037, partial [Cirrhinus mrigala]
RSEVEQRPNHMFLKKRKEYAQAKTVLKEKKIRFQTPYPAKLRVFYEGETVLYNSAEEATKDMKARGLQVDVIRPQQTLLERLQRRTWTTKRGRGSPEETTSAPEYVERLHRPGRHFFMTRGGRHTNLEEKKIICAAKRFSIVYDTCAAPAAEGAAL